MQYKSLTAKSCIVSVRHPYFYTYILTAILRRSIEDRLVPDLGDTISANNSIAYLHWRSSMASSYWGTASSC